MSFNVDDPLAGILSDDSDDSFFDDDILGKKKPAKAKVAATPEKKKSLFNLDTDQAQPIDNISTVAKKEPSHDIKKSDSFEIGINNTANFKAVSPAPFKKVISKETIQQGDNKTRINAETSKSPAKPKISASADTLDILGELNITKKEPTKAVDKGKSSQSLLDDILGASASAKPSSSQINRPSTTTKSQDFDFDSLLGKSDSKSIISSKANIQKPPPTSDKVGKEEQVTKKTKVAEDWLGIFNDKDEDEDVANMPAWLGGETKKKKVTEPVKVAEQISKPVKSEEATVPVPVSPNQEEPKEKNFETGLEADENFKMNSTILKSSNEDLTAQGATMYLQQQESQLMVALQLKAQEEKLAAMQLRQKESQRLQREAALAHHEQIDAMLQRQTQHRIQMQAVINAHQERITQRIKALLGTVNEEEASEDMPDDIVVATLDRKESPHDKEKKQLLQLIQSLQENHDKEIDLMETSYRRQLAFLEVSLNQSEERMKEESDKLTKYYSEKIIWLEEHYLMLKKMAEENLTSLTERHKSDNETIRQQHLESIRTLQEHHAALMENVKNAVKQEQTLIQDSVGFSSDLRELVSDVKDSKIQCQELLERVQSMAEKTERETYRALQVRETQVNDLIHQIKADRENFEKEKTENKEIVNLLEKRLKQMTMVIEEESAMLKQRKMDFEFEKATFSKQTEFAKNVLKKQDEEMKMLKEDIQREYQEKVTKINEEKMRAERDSAIIVKEKLSIQNLKQELEKMKTELQAQLEEVSEDRLKLNLEKQQMHMEEQRIMAKSRDLDMLAKAAVDKQTQADKKYSEAEFIQGKYEERIRRIQEHVISLNTREKQIAKEKVALSRERLSLHNERKKIENRQQCSLCRSAQYAPQYNFDSAFPESFLNVSVSRDQGDTNMSSAMNAIANEMVSLKMYKNYDLRHKFDTSATGDDRAPTDDNFQTMQTIDSTSGAFKDYMDPKFMMLRLDVQQVLSNLDETNKEDEGNNNDNV